MERVVVADENYRALAPLRVRFRSDVMTAIEHAIVSSASVRLGTETGGLLLGQVVADGAGMVVDIAGHLIIPSSRGPGESYTIPSGAFRDVRRDRTGANGRDDVVGYFRTQNDPLFKLRPHEYALSNELPDRTGVVLLVEVSDGRPAGAAIFHWDGAEFGRHPVPFNFAEAANPHAAASHIDTPKSGDHRKGIRKLRSSVIFIALLAASFAAGGIGAYWLRYRDAAIDVSGAGAASSPLQLSVARAADGILLTWNVRAAPNVKAGQVVITDGERPPEAVFLGTEELHGGKIVYHPQSTRIRFRVDLIDSANRELSDSVLVLGGPEPQRLSAGGLSRPDVGTQADRDRSAVMAPPAARAAAPAITPHTAASAPAVIGDSRRTAPRGTVGKFIPPPARSSLTAAERTVILDAPRRIARATTIAAPPGLQLSTPNLAPPPEPAPARKPPAYTPPVALTQVIPQIDPTIRSLVTREVQLEAVLRIDETGRVTDATILNPGGGFRSHLDRAALAAAKRWRFIPAQLDGKPVSSVQTVKFVFRK